MASYAYTFTSGDTLTPTKLNNARTISDIADVDISSSAEIAVSKLADGAARQLLQTDSAGTGVEWTSNVDVPGTLDVTGATTLDSTLAVSGLITASGGIAFGNETLSHYDEGTFTPTVTSGFTSPTYASQSGAYTRIGNRCFFFLHVALNGGTATGNQVIIGGLPFAISSAYALHFPTFTYYFNVAAAGGQNVRPLGVPGSTTVGLYTQGATGVAGLVGTTVGNAMDILITGTYRIN